MFLEEKKDKNLVIYIDKEVKYGDYNYKIVADEDDEDYKQTLLKLYNRVEHHNGYKVTINYDDYKEKEEDWINFKVKLNRFENKEIKEAPQLVKPAVDENIFYADLIINKKQFEEVKRCSLFNRVIFFINRRMKKRIQNDEEMEDLPIYFKKVGEQYKIIKNKYGEEDIYADDIYIGVLDYTMDYGNDVFVGTPLHEEYVKRKITKKEYQNDINNINITIEPK